MEMNASTKELHQLEHELHVELLPGTEIMVDTASHHFAKRSNKVLVPQPSDDPHDPLNWLNSRSPFWKTCAIVSSSAATFSQGFGHQSLAPMLGYLTQDFHCPLSDAVHFIAVSILVLGFSNFFWVPVANVFGRRPAYIFSQLINIGGAIWRAKATSYSSFLGACALNGFATATAETIQPTVIADIFFLDHRGFWTTVYFSVYFGSLIVGPVVSGPMAFHVGWRNFWWLYLAMCVFSLLLIVFLFPETRYHRKHPSELPQGLREDGTDVVKMGIIQNFREISPTEPQSDGVRNTNTPENESWLGRGGPSRAQFGLFTHNPHWMKQLLLDLWIPLKILAFPITHFASFVVSWSASVFLLLILTQVQVFAAPPYNFNPQSIGFFNLAVCVGALIGLATAGPLSDWISMRATKRNGGIREPEMRLPAMIPYVLIMIFGNFIAAFGYQYHWPWPAIIVFAYGSAGIQVAALPSIASTYAVDSYKPIASSLFVSITINKNLWGYGFAKFITRWTMSSGFIVPIMTNMCLTTLWCLFGFLFYFKGKTFRRWTRNDKVHTM